MYQHDPRHVNVLVLRLEHGNYVQTPATPDVTEEGESEPSDTGHRLPDVCSSVKIEQA